MHTVIRVSRIPNAIILVAVVMAVVPTNATCVNDIIQITPFKITVQDPIAGDPFTKQFTVKRWPTTQGSCAYTVYELIDKLWITSITPASFSLVADQSQVVQISGNYPAQTDYASIIIEDATSFQTLLTFKVTHTATGIEDRIEFTGGPAGANPTTVFPGQAVQYNVHFVDEFPFGANISGSWDWTMELQHQSGNFLFAQATTMGFNQSLWSETLGSSSSLPNLQWGRDSDGDVFGTVTVSATDDEQVTHTAELEIKVNLPPSKPEVVFVPTDTTDSVSIAFRANGATTYQVHYDTNSGRPYTGTDANEGPSPLDTGATEVQTLSGFDIKQAHFFSVRGVNANGQSPFSDELVVGLNVPMISPFGILLLGTMLLIAGAYLVYRRTRLFRRPGS